MEFLKENFETVNRKLDEPRYIISPMMGDTGDFANPALMET